MHSTCCYVVSSTSIGMSEVIVGVSERCWYLVLFL